jgi:hypothetical protein
MRVQDRVELSEDGIEGTLLTVGVHLLLLFVRFLSALRDRLYVMHLLYDLGEILDLPAQVGQLVGRSRIRHNRELRQRRGFKTVSDVVDGIGQNLDAVDESEDGLLEHVGRAGRGRLLGHDISQKEVNLLSRVHGDSPGCGRGCEAFVAENVSVGAPPTQCRDWPTRHVGTAMTATLLRADLQNPLSTKCWATIEPL